VTHWRSLLIFNKLQQEVAMKSILCTRCKNSSRGSPMRIRSGRTSKINDRRRFSGNSVPS
jgi:hypothetical protein